jgi:hypothetical protein
MGRIAILKARQCGVFYLYLKFLEAQMGENSKIPKVYKLKLEEWGFLRGEPWKLYPKWQAKAFKRSSMGKTTLLEAHASTPVAQATNGAPQSGAGVHKFKAGDKVRGTQTGRNYIVIGCDSTSHGINRYAVTIDDPGDRNHGLDVFAREDFLTLITPAGVEVFKVGDKVRTMKSPVGGRAFNDGERTGKVVSVRSNYDPWGLPSRTAVRVEFSGGHANGFAPEWLIKLNTGPFQVGDRVEVIDSQGHDGSIGDQGVVMGAETGNSAGNNHIHVYLGNGKHIGLFDRRLKKLGSADPVSTPAPTTGRRENNDGRSTCYSCGAPTRDYGAVAGMMAAGKICTKCKL